MQDKLGWSVCDGFEGTVPGMKFIGEDDKRRKNCLSGDIITNGNHIGVVVGNSQTINEIYSDKKVVRNS